MQQLDTEFLQRNPHLILFTTSKDAHACIQLINQFFPNCLHREEVFTGYSSDLQNLLGKLYQQKMQKFSFGIVLEGYQLHAVIQTKELSGKRARYEQFQMREIQIMLASLAKFSSPLAYCTIDTKPSSFSLHLFNAHKNYRFVF